MTEPRLHWSEADDRTLERGLHDLGKSLQFPPTPDLTARIRALVVTEPLTPPQPAPLYRRREIWLVAAVLLLAVGIALLLLPQARTTIADRLGLPGVVIDWVETPPEASPVGARFMLGRPVTLADAAAAVDFPVLVPRFEGFAAPREIYVLGQGVDTMISFVYPSREGLPPASGDVGALLTQFDGQLERNLIEKGLQGATEATVELEAVSVAGYPGFWISGAPHAFLIVCPDNYDCREEPYRLAANVLLWQQDGLTLRFESALTRDEALAIAASVRPEE
jgi:hypothetical protein